MNESLLVAAAARRAAIAARGGLFRTSSSRSGLGFGGAGFARSQYEEAQIMQRLQALERMHTMCQVWINDCDTVRFRCMQSSCAFAHSANWGFTGFGAALPSCCH